eukprot:10488062-Lingulodinium_polyedra.AAC.1
MGRRRRSRHGPGCARPGRPPVAACLGPAFCRAAGPAPRWGSVAGATGQRSSGARRLDACTGRRCRA